MNKWIKILLGLLLILITTLISVQYSSWGLAALTIIKGGVVICIAIAGLTLLLLGISDLMG